MDLKEIENQAGQAVKEIIEASHLHEGQLFVVGCSTSEVLGDKIGTHSSMDVAKALYAGISSELNSHHIYLAAQCCEHLNRSLVVEREVMEKFDLEQVNAIPQPDHAGGAFGTVTYQSMKDPVLVEDIHAKADAGMDIGGTLIGMHIHPVVVPLRISLDHIGNAILICARRRPKYTGGQRAIYDPKLM